MTKSQYQTYLQSPHWLAVRRRILARAQDHCEWCNRFCGMPEHSRYECCDNHAECEYCWWHFDETGYKWNSEEQRLEIHHKTYKRLGHENDGDLVALCWSCHEGVTERQIMLGDIAKHNGLPKSLNNPELAANCFWPAFVAYSPLFFGEDR